MKMTRNPKNSHSDFKNSLNIKQLSYKVYKPLEAFFGYDSFFCLDQLKVLWYPCESEMLTGDLFKHYVSAQKSLFIGLS